MKHWIPLSIPPVLLFVGLITCMFSARTLSCKNFPSVSVSMWHFNASSYLEVEAQKEESEWVDSDAIALRTASPFYYESKEAEKVIMKGHEEKLPELELTMILHIGKSTKLCRINGILYGEGDEGPNFRVLNIMDDSVQVLGDANNVITLRIKNDITGPIEKEESRST